MTDKTNTVYYASLLWIVLTFLLSCQPELSELDQPAIAFSAADVELLDGPFKFARDRAARNLLEEYDPDRFLAWIRPMAELKPKAEKYMGWETWLTTHSLGHYLSGCSLAWSQTGNPEFKERIDYVLEELSLIQELSKGGFIAKPSDRMEFETHISQGEISSLGFKLNDLRVPVYSSNQLQRATRLLKTCT